MFNSFFATYNIVDAPPQPAKTKEYVEEPKTFQDFYKQFIPQIIQQQEQIPDDIVPPDLSQDSELPDPSDFSIDIPEEVVSEETDTPDPAQSQLVQNVIGTARQYVGWNYISGGASPQSRGFDCSGLLSYAFKQNGIDIGRTTNDIFKVGSEVSSLSDVQPGDIICTPGTGATEKHVKMVSKVDPDTGQIYVIEAKGRQYGILEHPLTNTRNIITIRRVIGNELPTGGPTSGKFNNHREFVQTLNLEYQRALSNKGLDPRYSYILVAQDANESGWGQHPAGNFNYGGVKSKTGKKKRTFEYINGVKTQVYDSFRDFASLQDYCNYKINLLLGNTYNAFQFADATDPSKFIRHINDSGYSTTPSSTYVPYIMGIYRTVTKLA